MIYISLTLSPFPSPFPSRWHPTVHKFQWKINIPVKAGLNLSIHEVCGNEIARLSHEIAMRMFCKSNLDLDQVSAFQDLRRSEDSLLSNCVDSLLPNAPKCNGATVPIWPDLWTCFCSFFFSLYLVFFLLCPPQIEVQSSSSIGKDMVESFL